MSSTPRWLLRRTNFERNRNVIHRHSLSIHRFGIDAKDTSSHSFWPMYIRVLVPALSSFYFFIFLSSRFPSSCASCHFFSASTCKCSYRSRVMVRSISTDHFLLSPLTLWFIIISGFLCRHQFQLSVVSSMLDRSNQNVQMSLPWLFFLTWDRRKTFPYCCRKVKDNWAPVF